MVTSFYHFVIYNSVTDWRSADVHLFVFYLSLGLVRVCEIIRIHHECEGRIEKSVPSRITVWHHEACRVMTKVILRDGFFYPNLTEIMDSFFLLNTVFCFKNKLPESAEYTKIQFHMVTSL